MFNSQNEDTNTTEGVTAEGGLPANHEQAQVNLIYQLNQFDHRHIINNIYPAQGLQPEQGSVRTGDKEDLDKAFRKLKETTRRLYDSESDVDVSRFDNPKSNFPEVYPELLLVDFFEGSFIPNDDQYDPKTRQIKFSESDKKVSIDQLVSRCRSQNFLSIVGYPGSGKTTLSKRLARRLDQNKDFLVLRIPFMNMSDCSNEQQTLKDFLLDDAEFDLENQEKTFLFKWIKQNTRKCFFIFDGFDQVKWNLRDRPKVKAFNNSRLFTSQELVSNLCHGYFLRYSHIVFTSRPHAMLDVPQRCRPKQTYFVGELTTENMKTLIDALINDERKSSDILNKLTLKTPHLESMCHNPLMLQLYLKALSSSHETANISTMTQIFQRVLGNLKSSEHTISLTDEIVVKLSQIAYNATKNGTVLITTEDLKTINLSSRDVQDIVVALFASNKHCGLFEGNRRLYFSHQTFQEFFSALYMVHQMTLEDFTSFVQTNLLVDHWSVVVQFLSGLLLDPCINKGLSNYATNQPSSDESASALMQSSFQRTSSSSQVASTSSSHAISQQPSVESTLTQTPFLQTTSSQPPPNFLQDSFLQGSHASNQPQKSFQNSLSVPQKPKLQKLSRKMKIFKEKIFPSSFSSSTIQLPSKESDASPLQPPSLQSPLSSPLQQPSQKTRLSLPSEKLQKRKVFISELHKKTREVAVDTVGRAIINISRILREGNDEKVILTAGSHFDKGRIKMESSDTQNDFHAVTSFLKLMPARVRLLTLIDCKMTTNKFLIWVEAIKSMPGSGCGFEVESVLACPESESLKKIVCMNLRGNLLSSVDDVIALLKKVEEEVVMWECLDGDGKSRTPNLEEQARMQKSLNKLKNMELKIWVGFDADFKEIYLTHKNR